MANQLLGRVVLKRNGKIINSKRGATLMQGGVKRTPVVGSNGVHGFSEESVAPSLKAKFTQTPDFTLAEVNAITDETLLWDGDDGVKYVITGAFCLGEAELNEVDGEISVEFSGTRCEKL